MEMVGYWTLGLFTVSIALSIMGACMIPLMDYQGDNRLIMWVVDVTDNVFQNITTALFLSLPLAAVVGLYQIGRWVWSFVV